MSSNQPFNTAAVNAEITETWFHNRLMHLPLVGSTNQLAIEAAEQGFRQGVWIADKQTAGRGRGGHTWHSPAFIDGHPAGLYVSILLRPHLFGAEALKLSLAAALAAQTAIAKITPVAIDLRWPNDLMLTGPDALEKKLGGILTESAMEASGTLAHAVIGIGINLNQAEFPTDLAPLATSLRIVLGRPVSRERILAALLIHLQREVLLVEAESAGSLPPSIQPIAARFEQASTWTRNLRVHVDEQDGYTGITDGLDAHGLLRVRLDDGTLRTVRHGGVRRA